MSAIKRMLSVFPAIALAFALSSLQYVNAGQEKEYKPKVVTKDLVEQPLHGASDRTVIIKEFTLPAGHVGGRHFHTGPVYVYVLDGELTIELDGQQPQTVKAGELYVEPVGQVMQARNVSGSGELKLLVFQVSEAGKPMMIKAE